MRISFRLRLLAITALSVILALGVAVAVAGHASFQTRTEQSREDSLQHARALAYELQAELTIGMESARSLANTLRGYLETVPVDKRERQMWSAAVRAVLESHPQFSGVYLTCEPKDFDGRDAEFAGKPGEEPTGRFSPYWNRAPDGKLAAEATIGIEDATPGPTGVRAGEWYLRPRELKRECVIDPYPYEVQGRTVWMTTVAVPILLDGAFVGMAGVDIPLDRVQAFVEAAVKEGNVQALISSPRGILAATAGLAAKPGDHIRVVHGNDFEEDLAAVAKDAFVADDSSGEARIEVFAPLRLGGDPEPWAVNLLVDTSHFYAEAWRAVLVQVGFGCLAAGLALVVAWWLAGRIAILVGRMTRAVQAVDHGDFAQRVATTRSDELGDLGRALDATLGHLGTLDQRIRTGIGGNATALNTAAKRLGETSAAMTTAASSSAERAQSAAAGAEQVSANVTTVAASIEEMTATAKEIAGQSGEAATVAREGVQVAQEVGGVVQKLSAGSKQIGEIVGTIGSIAEQTNLLALNATIEAARAGDAGRGFAVVANEVKELARQSATAASDISQRVAAIQADIQGAVGGVARLAEIVARIDQTQQSIAAAIEQQTATTGEVGRNVAQAAAGNKDVAVSVAEVATTARRTTAGAGEVQAAAEELARLSAELDALVKTR